MRELVTAAGAAKAIGPYSPAVRAGNLLFVSGQIPLDPATGQVVSADIGAETGRVMENIGALLRAAGLDFSAVVRSTVFLVDLNDFAAMNAVYGSYLKEPFPARATVQVAALPRNSKVEIDVIASYD